MPRRYDDRYEICERLYAELRRGRSITEALAAPGMPDHRTLSRWAEADAGIRFQLEQAKGEQRAVEAQFWRRQPFNAAVARDFLKQVYFGRRVVDLVREPAFPNRDTLDRWKLENPAFAEELRAAVRVMRFETRNRHPYDEARADRLIQRLHAGATLAELLGQPGLPRPVELAAWRRREEGFDHAVRMAKLGGQRRRGKARSTVSPQMTWKIVEAIIDGRSIHQVGKMAGMPSHGSIYRWMRTQPEFAARIRKACLDRDEGLADRAVRIVEGMTPDTWRAAAAQAGAIRRHVAQMSWKPRA